MYKISFGKALAVLILLAAISVHTNAQTPAFPGAEGWGKYTTGGRGGTVYEVTNLNNSGPGSLRDAVSQPNRIVVFRVSGTIYLQSALNPASNITIAGQTAPGDGICVASYPTIIDTKDNIIIRYIRFRLGDEHGLTGSDAIDVNFSSNIILDHCSMSWGLDEVFSTYGNSSVSIQYCIVGEGLTYAGHSMGGLWGSLTTYHHNLIHTNGTRHPKYAYLDADKVADSRNNVVYNWNYQSAYTGTAGQINLVNNYYKAGPATGVSVADRLIQGEPACSLYCAGNYVDGYPAVTADNWLGVDALNGGTPVKMTSQITIPYPIPEQSAQDAYAEIVAHGGASLPHRDSCDFRVINNLVNGTGGLVSRQSAVGGFPWLFPSPAPADTDHDGMPNNWEIVHGLNPNSNTDGNGDQNSDGYTNIEEYLNHLVEYDFNGSYTLISRHSNKAVEVLDSSTSNEASVVQNAIIESDNQVWMLVATDSCYYSIINTYTGLTLDVEDSFLTDGANIVQNPFTGGDNQQWEIVELENDYYRIVNKLSGKSLDIEDQSTSNEAQMIQNTSSTSNSQQFTLTRYFDDNLPPRVVLTSPAIGALFSAGDTVTITADAFDNGSVAMVEFYANDFLVGKDSIAPYSYSIDSIVEGIYVIMAKAIDNKGMEGIVSSNFIVQARPSPGNETLILQESDISFCSIDPSGTVDFNHEGFTGTGFSNTDNAVGEGINWIIYVHEKDTFTLGIRYALESGNRPGSFVVDSIVVAENISLPSSGAWTTWTEITTPVIIDTGTHNIRLVATGSGGLPNIDYIKLTGAKISAVDCHPPVIENINLAEFSEILLFPNPAGQFVNIVLPENLKQNNLMNIYDYTGKLILSNRLAEGTNHTVNIESLQPGLYIVQIINENETATQRLIKK